MKLRYKIINSVLASIILVIAILSITISYTGDCPATPIVDANKDTMKAIQYRCYGSADVLEYVDVEKPTPSKNEILVKVKSASINPIDWHIMRGTPYLMRLMTGIGSPKSPRLGIDFSGTVEAIGSNVTEFKVGDDVFGGTNNVLGESIGTFSEYLTISANNSVVLKPANISFEQAATVGIAGVTAVQALRDLGEIKPGQKVLINGASGGVGTFAVQVAKSFGAEVTGVCSTRNIAMVKSIGADHIIDYKQNDYTQSGNQYDLIIDNVGNRSLLENTKVLTPTGRLIRIASSKGNWIAPLQTPLNISFISPFIDQEILTIFARMNKDDLNLLAKLMKTGQLTPVIDKRYSLSELAEAIRYSELGHARGKIIINM